MKKWLTESEESLSEALKLISESGGPPENMYMLAPIIYAKRQNMNNEALLKRMITETEKLVSQDFSIDPESKHQYKFHFVSSYLYCFYVAGRIDEFQFDKIMEYVNERMSLFSEDYGRRWNT